MLILGLLGMYFDAAVVFVTSQTLFQDWLWPYCEKQQDANKQESFCLAEKFVKIQNWEFVKPCGEQLISI